MKIERLELVGYKRLSLSGINSFIYIPDTNITLQTILGTNGSGKSSLLWELWPLPANKDDFNSNGYKELWINYNNKEYKLRSEFDGKDSRHSFLINNNELNDGFKIELFRNLCLDHFNVNNEIRNLCLGKEVLTNMSPARRRYWMVKISDTDYTYAMSVYKSLLETHRDVQGAIKRLKGRLIVEESKRVKKESIDILNNDCKDIRNILKKLYDKKEKINKPIDFIVDSLKDIESLNEKLINSLDKYNLNEFRDSQYTNINHVVCTKEKIENKVIGIKKLCEHLFKNHEILDKKYKLLLAAGKESIEQLENSIKELQSLIKIEESKLFLPGVRLNVNAKDIKTNFDSIYQDLYDSIIKLPINDGLYTTEKKNDAENKLNKNTIELNSINNKIANIKAKIDHHKKHEMLGDIKCPQCNFEFKLHFTENELKQLLNNENSLVNKQVVLKEENDELIKYISDMNNYSNDYRLVMRIIKNVYGLSNYFSELTSGNRLILSPGAVANDLSLISNDLNIRIKIDDYENKINEFNNQIQLKKSLSSDTLSQVEKELKKINDDLSNHNKELLYLNETIKDLNTLLKHHSDIECIGMDVNKNLIAKDNIYKDYVKVRYQMLLNDLISTLQTVLARKEDSLSAANNQELIIKDIYDQLKISEMNERVSKNSHTALSPTVGAIAYGLQSFINQFTGNMNKIINSIWSYPLNILPFKMDENNTELDYKFPFIKNGENKENKDVSLGSESMIDIFNFAFRFCVIKQLGLTHLPLYLDEFESAFDDVHREKAVYFVKRLIDEKMFDQIFMVSHYEHNHGALSSLSQTCVLNKDNLLLSSNVRVNEHVVIN